MTNIPVDRLFYIDHRRKMDLQNLLLPSKLIVRVAKMLDMVVDEPLLMSAGEVGLLRDV